MFSSNDFILSSSQKQNYVLCVSTESDFWGEGRKKIKLLIQGNLATYSW